MDADPLDVGRYHEARLPPYLVSGTHNQGCRQTILKILLGHPSGRSRVASTQKTRILRDTRLPPFLQSTRTFIFSTKVNPISSSPLRILPAEYTPAPVARYAGIGATGSIISFTRHKSNASMSLSCRSSCRSCKRWVQYIAKRGPIPTPYAIDRACIRRFWKSFFTRRGIMALENSSRTAPRSGGVAAPGVSRLS